MPPNATAARKNIATVCIGMARASRAKRFVGRFGGIERPREALFFAVVTGAVPEPRPRYARGAVAAVDLPVRILAEDVKDEEILGNQNIAFHADDFRDVGDLARTVAQALAVDDNVDGGRNHRANRVHGKPIAAHGDHGLESRQRLARRVRVHGAHRTVVAGVHRLQQVKSFRPTHLADDDPIRPHAQAVAHEIAHGHLALAFEVGRPGLQPHHVGLLQLQFGGVFAGDDTLAVVDELGETIEKRRLARARAARNQRIHPATADDAQNLGSLRRDGAELDQLVERELVLPEFADRQRRAVDGEGRRDDVDARAVGKARIADRRGFVDATADLADDPLTDIEELLVVAEADTGLLDLALDFDVDRAGAVYHDVGDVIAREQRLERSESKHVVAYIVEQFFLLGDRHHDVLDRDDLVDDIADLFARRLRVEAGKLREINGFDERAENDALGLVIGVRAVRVDRRHVHGDRGRARAG